MISTRKVCRAAIVQTGPSIAIVPVTGDGSATCSVILTTSSWPSFSDEVAGGSTSGPLRVRSVGRTVAVNVVDGKTICCLSFVAVVVAAACHVSVSGCAAAACAAGFARAASAGTAASDVVMRPAEGDG